MSGPAPAASRPLVVAHRAGNDLATLQAAVAAGADVVEADIHLRRGRLEVRHTKSLGPLPWRWEQSGGRVVLHPAVRVDILDDLLDAWDGAAGAGGAMLMLDLKGPHPALASRVAAALSRRRPAIEVWVSTRHWWMAPTISAVPGVRMALSARSPRDLRALGGRLRQSPPDGVCVHRSLLDREVVAGLHAHVPRVLTWPVASDDDLDAVMGLGVTGVICEGLDLVARARAVGGPG